MLKEPDRQIRLGSLLLICRATAVSLLFIKSGKIHLLTIDNPDKGEAEK